MSKVSYYTAEGLKKLREELHQLKDVDRVRASQAIGEARDKGDLSENELGRGSDGAYHHGRGNPGGYPGDRWPVCNRWGHHHTVLSEQEGAQYVDIVAVVGKATVEYQAIRS